MVGCTLACLGFSTGLNFIQCPRPPTTWAQVGPRSAKSDQIVPSPNFVRRLEDAKH